MTMLYCIVVFGLSTLLLTGIFGVGVGIYYAVQRRPVYSILGFLLGTAILWPSSIWIYTLVFA